MFSRHTQATALLWQQNGRCGYKREPELSCTKGRFNPRVFGGRNLLLFTPFYHWIRYFYSRPYINPSNIGSHAFSLARSLHALPTLHMGMGVSFAISIPPEGTLLS